MITNKEEMDKYLEKGQIEAKNRIYKNKSVRFVFNILFAILLILKLVYFVYSLIYYDIDIFEFAGMLTIIIFQIMLWLCILKESCWFYFRKAIANYYYQGFLGIAYLFSERLFMWLCPV